MATISGRYESDLRCRSIHEASGVALITDAPVDNQGLGRSFSPTDLVAAALGTCMLTIMGIWAQRNGVDLAGTTFEVSKEMATTTPRRIARLTVRFKVPTPTTPEQRVRLEQAARACPVSQSLHPDVAHDVSFDWA